MRIVLSLALIATATACVEPEPELGEAPAAVVVPPLVPPIVLPPTHHITVNADGTFTPMWTTARKGDWIVWHLSAPTDTVIRALPSGPYPAMCDTPAPWDPAALNNGVTGPMPIAPGGVFTLSPVGAGLYEQAAACPGNTEVLAAGGAHLCQSTAPGIGAVMPSTWADPSTDGVFIRLLWNQVEPLTDCSSSDPTTCWDWSVLDREVQAAVDHGKVYSVSVKAGDDGTPDWLFTTDPPVDPFANPVGALRNYPTGGVTRLFLQDSGNDTAGCGAPMYLGNPTEQRVIAIPRPPLPPLLAVTYPYRAQYFDMLRALAAHLKSRSDWYRALAYVKPSGANLQSHENRLPKRCTPGCVCNTAVWASAGYTPQGLYDFYAAQFELLAELFPGKAQSYALIQQGFPRVTGPGVYLYEDAGGNELSTTGNLADLPAPAEQTETIMALGADQAALSGHVWVVSHNGLGPSAAPNQHVLDAATADTTTVTGFQTNNDQGVANSVELDATFVNLETSAPEASYLEIYEDRHWEAQHLPGQILDESLSDGVGTDRTLGDWSVVLRDRIRTLFPSLPDPDRLTYLSVAQSNLAVGNTIVHFVHGSKCGQPGALYGALKITP